MVLIAAAWALASTVSAAPRARIEVVELKGALTAGGKTLAVGQSVDGSAPLELSADGAATLRLPQGLILLKGPATFFADRDALTLNSGGLLAVLRKLKRKWRVVTPRAVAAVRGTTFFVQAGPYETYLCLCEGSLSLSAAGSKEAPETITATSHTAFRLRSSAGRLDKFADSLKAHTDEEIAALKARL